ncbi:hypothetical protein ACOMHN_053365 [Nucella lapillus]
MASVYMVVWSGIVFLFCFFWLFGSQVQGQNHYMVNVAPRGTCSQSSVHSNNDTMRVGNNCTAAINGNVSTIYTPGNCIHTLFNDSAPFWSVVLDKMYTILFITVYGRTDGKNTLDRTKGVEVKIDNRKVFKFPNDQGKSINKTTTIVGPFRSERTLQPVPGRTVTLSKEKGIDIFLNICEVQIWVCGQGRYGENCTDRCGKCARGSTCDFHSGNCSAGCKDGWLKPLCKVCREGRYGKRCKDHCGKCAGGSPCEASNGRCPDGCQQGLKEPLCKGEHSLPHCIILHDLRVIGGATVKDATVNMLRHLFGPTAAEKYCWNGSAEGRKSFSTLRLEEILFKAVRRNPSTREATNPDIKKVAQEWFRTAVDRNGGRQRRQKTPAVEVAVPLGPSVDFDA